MPKSVCAAPLLLFVIASPVTGFPVVQEIVEKAVDARQQEQPEPKKSPDEQARDEYLEEVESRVIRETRRVLAAELLAELDDLDDMFQLGEEKLRKLRLAARGAASKAVDAARNNSRATINRMVERRLGEPNVNVHAMLFNGEKVKISDAPKRKENEPPTETLSIVVSRRATGFYFTVRYRNGSSSTSVGPRDTEVRGQEIWKKATEGVLTNAQLLRYRSKREVKLKEAVVDMLIASMAWELRLKEEQLPKIREVINKKITVNANTFNSGLDSVLRTCRTQLDPKDFKAVLTEVQMDLFESAQAYYRRYLIR